MKHAKVLSLRSLRAEMKAAACGEKAAADIRAEYEFDYRKAKPNRFASQMTGDVVVRKTSVRKPRRKAR